MELVVESINSQREVSVLEELVVVETVGEQILDFQLMEQQTLEEEEVDKVRIAMPMLQMEGQV